MTDNQDSVAAGAVQPPTDRPMTAGDVPLLFAKVREAFEDVLSADLLMQARAAANRGLKALSASPAASEGEARDVLWKALQKYAMTNMGDGDGNGYPLIDLMSNDGTTVATGREEMLVLADHLSEALEKAALASPPVSERERELEGALRAADQCIRDLVEVYANGGSMVVLDLAVKSLRDDAGKKVTKALTAQPAGEGK